MYPGERFNAITHVVGTALAVAGTAVLIVVSSGARRLTALSIYGAMMIAAYLSSTLYHSIRHGKAKQVFHVFDHCAIYLLIAGTYTPFTLVTLRGTWGWWLFAIVWSIAVVGVVKDALFHGRYRALSVILYLAMGWLVVVAFTPLTHALPRPGILLLIAGGIVYTAGIFFFAM